MLLAEALNERADVRRRLIDLRRRLADNVRVLEGERPAEDPQTLLYQAFDASERLRALVVAVNLTNAATALPDGTIITAALGRRDALDEQIRVVTDAASRASDRVARSGRIEFREVALLDVGALRGEADRLMAERRELDAMLQQANWSAALTVTV